MRFTLVLLSALFCLNAAAQGIEKSGDDALVAEAEKLVSEEAALNATLTTSAKEEIKTEAIEAKADIKNLKESEIPVLTEVKKEAKSDGSIVWRMLGSMALVAVVAGATIYASRRFKHQKSVGGTKARIETLHQVHFGPRKSIALIRVAGEVMLIGMTDTNITMMKQVMLIDDELEKTMGDDFNKYLQDDFAIEDVRNAITRA
jgi:flagellar protein FliO/FliZ